MMSRSQTLSTLGALCCLSIAGCSALRRPDPAVFDQRLRAATVDYYLDQLEDHYPYFDQLDIDWEAVAQQTREAAIACKTRAEFVQVVARTLSLLEDPHLSLELPFAMIAEEDVAWTVPDLRFALVEGRMYIARWRSGEEPECPPSDDPASMRSAGSPFPELVHIDGCAPSFGLLVPLLAGAPETEVVLGLRWPDGSTSEHRVQRLPAGRQPPRIWSQSLLLDERGWVSWARIEDLGYMHLATFSDNGDNGTRDEMLDDLARAFDALAGVEGLILDLQYNGGGDALVGAMVANHIVDEPFVLGVMHDRFWGWIDFERRLLLDPEEDSYDGPVVILVNGYTGSMAEHLSLGLLRAKRAHVVGDRTVGAEAAVRRCVAPDGSTLKFGERRITDEHGNGFQGVGVLPPHEVPLKLEAVYEHGLQRASHQAEGERIRIALELLGSSVDPDRIPRPSHIGHVGIRAGAP